MKNRVVVRHLHASKIMCGGRKGSSGDKRHVHHLLIFPIVTEFVASAPLEPFASHDESTGR
jgi:hypothetical protein